MATLTFDTHAFVKELTQAGMPEEQAEVLARSQATLIDEKLATKQDLKELELRLKRDIQELKRDMKELETRLVRDTAGNGSQSQTRHERTGSQSQTRYERTGNAIDPRHAGDGIAFEARLDRATRLDDGGCYRRGCCFGETSVRVILSKLLSLVVLC